MAYQIIADYERNGYHDSDFFWGLWNSDTKTIEVRMYGSTRGGSYDHGIVTKPWTEEDRDECLEALTARIVGIVTQSIENNIKNPTKVIGGQKIVLKKDMKIRTGAKTKCKCPSCAGTGKWEDTSNYCFSCAGTGIWGEGRNAYHAKAGEKFTVLYVKIVYNRETIFAMNSDGIIINPRIENVELDEIVDVESIECRAKYNVSTFNIGLAFPSAAWLTSADIFHTIKKEQHENQAV